MKKFHFSLDSVKSFKEQELEDLKRQHGEILARVRRQEEKIDTLKAEHTEALADFNRKKQQGVTVIEAQSCDIHIRKLQKNIDYERRVLAQLQKEEQAARELVVEKKKETSSLEKLREKRVDEYNKAVQKEEEAFIDEIVLNKRAAASL